MHLTGVAVRHWRGLDEVELGDLDPGLNLVLGENESGKSRLAQALWYGLFESSKGKAAHKMALASWEGGGEPWVEVGFATAGDAYRVEKTFGRTQCSTHLSGAGCSWSGEEAEQRLAELLRVGSSGGGRPARPEELGVWPLLWVRQFHSGRAPHTDLNDETRARLQDVLADAVGDVAAGPAGHDLLEKARSERAHYFTERGQERAPLKDASAAVDAAEQMLGEATRARREFEGAAVELEQLQRELARQEEDRQRTAASLEEARRVAGEVGKLQSDLQIHRGQVKVLEARLSAARREVDLRGEREAALERTLSEIGRLERDELDRLEALGTEHQVALTAAEEEARRTQEQLRMAAAELNRARQQRRRGEAERRLVELQQRCDRARAASVRAHQAAEKVAGLGVDSRGVSDLRQLQHQLATTHAQVHGAATRVTLRAERELEIDGEMLAADDIRSWSCSDAVQVVIAGVGVLEVVPGGEDLGRLRTEAERLAERCGERLASMGVESLEAAEAMLRDRERLGQEQAGAERLLAELCPEGLDALDTALAAASGERSLLGAQDADALEEPVAEERHAALVSLVEERRGSAEVHRRSLGKTQAHLAASRARVQGLHEVATGLESQLETMIEGEELAGDLAHAERDWQRALATATGLEARLAELGGDTAQEVVERLQKALEGLRTEAEQMHRRRAGLETTLDILAGQNLHEVEQEASARLAEAQDVQRRVARRAAAARTLADTLEACRAESQSRLLAPAVAAVGKHLAPLFPSAHVHLAEDMSLAGLQTETRTEPLLDLSGGTREQVGVAVRLGLAELLAAGERLPLLLDDALTNTDFRRIERLHQILFAAAANLQILVFSCHPEAFAGLGAGKRYRLPSRAPR